MKNLIKKIIMESDEFDWIRDITPLSYEDLVGKALEFTPTIDNDNTLTTVLNFLTSLGFTYRNFQSFISWDTESVLGLYLAPNGVIIWTDNTIDEPYQEHIHSYVGGNVEVFNGWDLLSDYLDENTLNESEDDDWGWARDLKGGIQLETNTLYYFKPSLNQDEVYRFANDITNSRRAKEWFIKKVVPKISESEGLKYFVTDDSLEDRMAGWCTSTDIGQAIQFYYPGINTVDARNEFFF